jgi:hypothetical protein
MIAQKMSYTFGSHVNLTFSPAADRRSKAAKAILLSFALLALASPVLLVLDIHSLIALAVCLIFWGLAGDAYLEVVYANESGKDEDDSIQKTGLTLLLDIIKKSPRNAMLNYFMALCILALVFISLKFGDISRTERFALVVLVFLCALMSILLIWFMRRIRP